MKFKNFERRLLIKRAVALCALATFSRAVSAVFERQVGAFAATDLEQALKQLRAENALVSDKIQIMVPDIAENSALVPVTVSTSLNNARRVSVLVGKNPAPLVASYEFYEDTKPYVSMRVKMLETSDVIVVVEADGKFYQARKEVSVVAGGCG